MPQANPIAPCLAVLLCGAPALADDGPAVSETVSVFGNRQSRQVQNISADDQDKALPGSSPLKTLEKLPGINFQSADAFGSYEWSARFGMRGFGQNQIGFTLDGIPLGDMSYGNNNGLHISRAIASENMGRVAVSQGAGALGLASSSNLGGTVQFYSLPPAEQFGFRVSQTLGSHHTSHSFARIDSGALTAGTKLAFSVSRHRADKWKGDGGQDQDQYNLAWAQPLHAHRLSGFYNYSDRSETDYQDMSLEMKDRLGYDWDNYAPDWQRAVDAANGQFRGAVNNLDDAYYLGRGLRRDRLGGLTLELNPAPALQFKSTYYHHSNQGQGHWYTPYSPSSATVPISIRTTEYDIDRDGILVDGRWQWEDHALSAGFWLERSRHGATRNFYAVQGPEDTNRFLDRPMSTGFKQDFLTTTQQFYLQDSLTLLSDKLRLNFGFKSPRINIKSTSLVGSRAAGQLLARKRLLPQIGFNYAMAPGSEWFGSLSRNMRAYQPGVSGPFSQTQTAFDLTAHQLKPETSTVLDLGYRFKSGEWQGAVAVYAADFKDRILNIALCSGIVGCPNTIANIGKVSTHGMEVATNWAFDKQWNWFNALTFNRSLYRSDYLDNGKLIAISGKRVVDSPQWMFNTELSMDAAPWFARIGGKYSGKRYYTYLNDSPLAGYWVGSLSMGYKYKSGGPLREMELQLNVDNLLNKRYFSTTGSNGYVTSDPAGTFATSLTGAPRQVFLSLSGRF
ncbi:TonB-dependent receptor [Chitinimonas arctica]|uniref:TonB-dependent receptor n=1 Tax=Chitinimonas arctica TaxID=2594795 RepID=A0A516SA22_9NEIS|nr:TonB-dependent receptor [Chitinimonas arctica]QDQ24987.1 TonB-dependent receptor [Chitinimonas arctica]